MKQPYAFYPIIGGLSFTFLALLAMVFTIYDEWVRLFPYPLNYAVFYYFVGIIIELIFFSLGLGFKHRMDEVEKVEAQQALRLVAERQEFERYKSMTEARETERTRIAKDLAAARDAAIKSLYDRVHRGPHGTSHAVSAQGLSEHSEDALDITVPAVGSR